ncbi:MAG: alpha/beta fold hydrolase [Singulisphaera sp.]
MSFARSICWLVAIAILGVVLPRTAFAVPTSGTLDVGGVKIRYFVEGQGEPVLLVHGLHANAAMNWMANGVFTQLAKNYQVIALDLPGHGQSDKPHDEKAYGVQIVKDIVALLDHLHIKQAHVVGYSFGGMIAMKLLVMHPERVTSAVIGGMGWMPEGSRLQDLWDRLPARDNARTPPELVRTIGQLAISEKELKTIATPAEVIIGGRDPVLRLYVEPLRAARPDWPVVEIADAGHITCILQPEFREAILEWLREHAKK